MCKIDAAFAAISLDEKVDPLERFTQALDECKIDGDFRALLLKHFADNWRDVLGDISSVEKVLSVLNASDNNLVKLIEFVKNERINSKLRQAIWHINEDSSAVSRYPLFKFVIDAAREITNASPFDLYESALALASGISKVQLLQYVFGDDYFSDDFFNAQALKGLDADQRTEKLWRFFCQITASGKNLAHSSTYRDLDISPEDLLAYISSSECEGPPTKQTCRLQKGFEFLKCWLKFDAQSGIFHSANGPFLMKFKFELSELESLGNSLASSETDRIQHWRRRSLQESELVFLINFSLASASSDIKQLWAKDMERHFNSFCSDWLGNLHLPHEKRRQKCLEEEWAYLDSLKSKLTTLQIDTWIQCTVEEYIRDALSEGRYSSQRLHTYGRWCYSDTYERWRLMFVDALKDLSIEQQLKVLAGHTPFPSIPTSMASVDVESFWQEHSAWWDSLLQALRTKDDFTKSLLPSWTIVAWSKCSNTELLTDIDNSIGYLRGEVSKSNSTEAQSQVIQGQLTTLLGYLDSKSWEKSLKHRLIMLRSSKIPFADESLNYRRELKEAEWYLPLRELSKHQYAKVTGPFNHHSETEQSLEAFCTKFAIKVAEFCLSRLRLRKGERVKDGMYDPEQSIEPSSIWRQGYLKALSEIGFDLNGQVHKAIFFVKESDPDANVRAIAKEAYKSVRRQSSPSSTIVDLMRGIVAAEWWLLMCQRQELKLEVDHAAALNTRRKLLRNT
ncbi:hypothetical protein [Rheinheimera aquimaris]|uniref:hypothetical protein n=1 Tax=Rheinheimera aquimaris TaxID=412437 RepID=UPI001065072D|nr:hypothetical protein [Rheinheimera aquimaris]